MAGRAWGVWVVYLYGHGYGIWCVDVCVGTWLNADNGLVNGKISVPSNVTRLSRAIHPVSRDGIPQVVYYHFGVGSQGGIVDKVVGGECYSVHALRPTPHFNI